MRKAHRRASSSPRSRILGLFWMAIICIGLAAILLSCGTRHASTVRQGSASGPQSPRMTRDNHMARSMAHVERRDESSDQVDPEENNKKSDKKLGTATSDSSSPTLGTNDISPTAGSREETPQEHQSEPAREVHSHRTATSASEIARVSSAGNKVALTFDAGASAVPAPELLHALRSYGLHATFFLTGKWCEANPELVRQIAAEGHEIANHTYSHPDLRKLSDDQIKHQLQKTDEIVERITGTHTAPYFRPPFGGRDKRVISDAANAGYTTIYWSLDSWDAFKKGITSEEITRRVLSRIHGGDIVLMHCGSDATAKALPGLINEIQKRGYEIVKVSDLIGH